MESPSRSGGGRRGAERLLWGRTAGDHNTRSSNCSSSGKRTLNAPSMGVHRSHDWLAGAACRAATAGRRRVDVCKSAQTAPRALLRARYLGSGLRTRLRIWHSSI